LEALCVLVSSLFESSEPQLFLQVIWSVVSLAPS